MSRGRISKTVAELVLRGVYQVDPAFISEDELAILDSDDDSVALEPYRALLANLVERDGGVTLLQAGRSLRGLQDPFLFVLLNSDSVPLLFAKEARLARFIHSRHRLEVVSSTPCGIVVAHVSAVAGAPPSPGEDLAACGQHIELLNEIGCRGLRLRFPRSADPLRWVYDNGALVAPAPGAGFDLWVFEWISFQPTRRPMPGLDEILLATATTKATGAGSWTELDEREGTAAAMERVIRCDLARNWSLADVVGVLGMSPRSLQRALQREATTFSQVVNRLRLDKAEHLLVQTAMSITEIGYVCGFADGAHFTRRFKHRHGQTPSEYRATEPGGGKRGPDDRG